MVLLAHGSAGRTDLPLSLWVFAYLAAMAVLLTWMATAWREIRLDRPERPLDPWAVVAARAAAVLVLAAVVVSAWHGDRGRTSTPHAVAFIGIWIGLPVTSVVLGDVLRRPPPPLLAATHWPAAAGLFAYAWLALVRHPDRPEVIGLAVLAYVTVMLAVGARRRRTADGIRVWSSLAAGVRRLHAVEVRPGTRAVLAVAVGAALLTVWDRDGILELTACVVVAAVAMRFVEDVRALVPVAVAWFVAAHLSLLLVQGQVLLAVLSDPLGRGWDLFGTADRVVDFGLVPDRLFVVLQWSILAAGHALGVLVDRSRRSTLALLAGSGLSVALLLGR